MNYNIGDLLQLKGSTTITTYRSEQIPENEEDYENGEKEDLYLITDYITFYCYTYDENRTGWLLCSQKSSTKSFWPDFKRQGIGVDVFSNHFVKVE